MVHPAARSVAKGSEAASERARFRTAPPRAVTRTPRSAPWRHRPVSRGSGRMSRAIDSPRNSGVRRTRRSIEDADIV